MPDGIDAKKVIDIAFRRYDLSLGGGTGRLVGKVFRIGHVGDINELMVLGALSGVEMALNDTGIPVTLGSGVAAAQQWFREARQPRVWPIVRAFLAPLSSSLTLSVTHSH